MRNILSVGDSVEIDKMTRNYDKYFYSKCIWAIAYSNNVSEMINVLFSNFNIDYDVFCDMLDIFLGYNYDCIDSASKKNLNYLIEFLHGIPSISNGQGFYNKFKGLLNTCDTSRVRGLILSEYELRYMSDDISDSLSLAYDDKYFSKLKGLIVNDLNVLISHLYCDNQSFDKFVDSYMHNSLNYIGSINKIISERPDILNNTLFLSRVHHVCDKLESCISDGYVKKIYNSFRGKIN